MIVFRNLETNEIIEFANEDSVGKYFLDESKFEKTEETNLFYLNHKKQEKIKQVKAEAAKRIDKVYPQYKQINYGSSVLEILNKENYAIKQGTTYALTDDDKLALGKAKACKDFISLIRSKSDELETLINSKRTIGTLTSINISDDIYWS